MDAEKSRRPTEMTLQDDARMAEYFACYTRDPRLMIVGEGPDALRVDVCALSHGAFAATHSGSGAGSYVPVFFGGTDGLEAWLRGRVPAGARLTRLRVGLGWERESLDDKYAGVKDFLARSSWHKAVQGLVRIRKKWRTETKRVQDFHAVHA